MKNPRCGGPWQGISICPKCSQEFDDYKAGSWDWEPHICSDCRSYEMMLKMDKWKEEHPEEYQEWVNEIKKLKL